VRAIFISYRRDDSEGEAGRLFDDLVKHFGEASVFIDVAGIEAGRDFRRAIDESVASCGVLLAVIGRNWVEAKDEIGQRRLDDPSDFVRLETASALKRDIPVIPVLVHGAKMPRPDQLPDDLKELAYRNGVELTHTRWASDLQLLIKALRRALTDNGPSPSPRPNRVWRAVAVALLSVFVIAAACLGAYGVYKRYLRAPTREVISPQATEPAPVPAAKKVGPPQTPQAPIEVPPVVTAHAPQVPVQTNPAGTIEPHCEPTYPGGSSRPGTRVLYFLIPPTYQDGQILLDGKCQGTSEKMLVNIPTGMHQVAIRKSPYPDLRKDIQVPPSDRPPAESPKVVVNFQTAATDQIPPAAPTLARAKISGVWRNERNLDFTLKQNGDAIVSDDVVFGHGEGRFTGLNTIVVVWGNGQKVAGTIYGNRINWSNGSIWTR
jgi:hypothetical protein